MRVRSGSARDIVFAVGAGLPDAASVRGRGRRWLTLTMRPPGAEPVKVKVPLTVSALPGTDRSAVAKMALQDVVGRVSQLLRQYNMTWRGLQTGLVRVRVQRFRDGLVVSVSDEAGHVTTFPRVRVWDRQADELPESPDGAALLAELASEKSEVDQLAQWLLRVGIDHTGELVLTDLWDVAVRAAVLADLQRCGRLTETEDQIEVDTTMAGLSYENEACAQLLESHRSMTFASWLRSGELRASDVAVHLVETGEWTSRLSPLATHWHTYRAPKQQYVQLRRRLAHTYDGDFSPLSDDEAALAVIGHVLNVVRPQSLTLDPGPPSPLRADGCGALAQIVGAAEFEIRAQAAEARANPNPAW